MLVELLDDQTPNERNVFMMPKRVSFSGATNSPRRATLPEILGLKSAI